MYRGKKVVVVMPAYNAANTLVQTYDDVMSQDFVDFVIVVDDGSCDGTAELAGTLNEALVHVHEVNRGYGANQKSCYRLALEAGAEIVIMVHPDYQYTPKLIPAMVTLIGSGLFHLVLGSRILGGGALSGGMPRWRYVANRILTAAQNLVLSAKLSEYHTGYRAFSRALLERLPIEENANDFVFDNQMLAQAIWFGYAVAEISCPTRYAPESSSISFWRAVRYGIGCLATTAEFGLARLGLNGSDRFPPQSYNSARSEPIDRRRGRAGMVDDDDRRSSVVEEA